MFQIEWSQLTPECVQPKRQTTQGRSLLGLPDGMSPPSSRLPFIAVSLPHPFSSFVWSPFPFCVCSILIGPCLLLSSCPARAFCLLLHFLLHLRSAPPLSSLLHHSCPILLCCLHIPISCMGPIFCCLPFRL